MGGENKVWGIRSVRSDPTDDVRSANGRDCLVKSDGAGGFKAQAIELVRDVLPGKKATWLPCSSAFALVGSKKLHGVPEFGQSISQGKNKWTATLIRACSFQWIGVSS